MKKTFALLASAAVLGAGFVAMPAAAQEIEALSVAERTRNADIKAAVLKWHDVMLDVHAVDFRDPGPNAPPEQVGPTRTSRAFAMVMVSVYDAVNAFDRRRTSYNNIPAAQPGASEEVAIAYAARDTLVALWPGQAAAINAILAEELTKIGATGAALNRGRTVGQNAAAAMLAVRGSDGSQIGEVNFGDGGKIATGTTNFFGEDVNSGNTDAPNWTPDPLTENLPGGLTALGANWGAVKPFALITGSQFRAPPAPATGTVKYRRDFNDVKLVGESPDNPGSGSTPRGIFIGNFWGYDGPPKLGVPPRLYAQIAEVLAERGEINNPLQLARYFALVHVSMADSGIGAWDSKYFYNYWRPVTGIPGDDGDAATVSDPDWIPVGVSRANVPAGSPGAVRATPAFPAYVSGHATFGAALFETARGFMPENTTFTFVSDEYNGITTDPFLPSVTRPLVPVRYRNLTAPTLENARSRITNGVHWQFDGDEGVKMGVSIAKFARSRLFKLN